MDLLALAIGLGLLFLLFRQTERWLHQHIFKLGWLLSNSLQVTTVVYTIIFLPGIILHESVLWLAAGLLNVRAERSIRFPELQDIGELRLNFIMLADSAGRVKRLIIRVCPAGAGILALWAIAVHVFQWEALLELAASGSLDALLEAVASLAHTADVWLWFYLTFVFANTMFPTSAERSDRREKALVLVVAPLLVFGLWQVAGAANPAGADAIEALAGSIALIVSLVMFINLFTVVILGTVEALIERSRNRSATFVDGKMITMSRAELREFKSRNRRDSRGAKSAQPKPRSAPVIKSVYEIKLPIPGPPGREPISRSAVAIVDPTKLKADAEAAETAQAPNIISIIEPASPKKAFEKEEKRAKSPMTIKPEIREDAPFARPFVEQESTGGGRRAESGQDAAEPFARPFASASRSTARDTEAEAGEPSFSDKPDEAGETSAEASPSQSRRSSTKRQVRTRPAPKPSRRNKSNSKQTTASAEGELEYESFGDDDRYAGGDEGQGESRSSISTRHCGRAR